MFNINNNPPRGFRDILPKQQILRESVKQAILRVYRDGGFLPIQTPSLEHIANLTHGAIGENSKLIFKVLSRKANEDTNFDALCDLGLRFDLTMPLIRYYVNNKGKLPNVFKALQYGSVWRAERPQKNRYREFMQIDIDTIGDGSLVCEIELLINSIKALNAVGISKPRIYINDRSIINDTIYDVSSTLLSSNIEILTILDKVDKVGIDGVKAMLRCHTEYADGIINAIENINIKGSRIDTIINAVNGAAGYELCVYMPYLVRGINYYSSTVFEIIYNNTTICGGGRYDGAFCSGQSTVYGCGISIGFERIAEMVNYNNVQSSTVLLYDEIDESRVADMILNGVSGRQITPFKKSKNIRHQIDSLKSNGFSEYIMYDSSAKIEVRKI